MPRNTQRSTSLAEIGATFFLLSIVYYLIRLPTAPLGLPYHDDGETLYRVLIFLSGRVPYIDDYTHHFVGYALPFLVAAKIIGFSVDLIREVAQLTFPLTALGLFLCMRLFVSYGWALSAALLLITAREPFVLSYFIQYQINLLFVWIWLCLLRYVLKPSLTMLLTASLLAGLVAIFDQRALLISALVPITIWLARTRLNRIHSVYRHLLYGLISWTIFPALALLYLYLHGALVPFFEQTLIYPFSYRSSSIGLWRQLEIGVAMHRYLLEPTPFLVISAALGLIALLLGRTPIDLLARRLVLLTAIPLFFEPLLGSRDLEYYCLTWVPWLSFLGALSASIVPSNFKKLSLVFPLLPLFSPLAAAWMTFSLLHSQRFTNYQGDGMHETVAYLQQHLGPEDSLYVIGYRLEIYARLKKLSVYPMVNRSMIHADQLITGAEDRLKSINPEYQDRFEEWVIKTPATYFVTFEREATPNPWSPSAEFLNTFIEANYVQVFEVTKEDFSGSRCNYKVFHLR